MRKLLKMETYFIRTLGPVPNCLKDFLNREV